MTYSFAFDTSLHILALYYQQFNLPFLSRLRYYAYIN